MRKVIAMQYGYRYDEVKDAERTNKGWIREAPEGTVTFDVA